MHRRHFQSWLAGLSAALAFRHPPAGADQAVRTELGGLQAWPCWRGPERTAYTPAEDWPDSLASDHLQLQWQVELQKSYSGPIVIGDQVITTESLAKDEQVLSLDRETGTQRWAARWVGSMSVPFFAASNGSWIRATPASDGQRVLVGGMRDYLACVDLGSGQVLYAIDFKERFQSDLPAFGQVCSPLIDGDRFYLQAGGGLVCLDLASGETIWRSLAEKDGMMSAFSSPIIATLHGRRQLVVQMRDKLSGIDLADGQVLWSQAVASFRGMNILTPTVWNDCLFTSSYGGKSLLFELEPQATGPWQVRERWSGKAEAYMSSPVVIGDQLYLHLRNQRLVCLDLPSGRETWRSRPYGKYWSMITNGRRILALDEQGKLFLIQPNPEKFVLLDERKITDDECWAHLAKADQQLFIRRLEGLMAFQWS
jgi:outer membrane protein assembly factor BamB